jgi:hypothetical protein
LESKNIGMSVPDHEDGRSLRIYQNFVIPT